MTTKEQVLLAARAITGQRGSSIFSPQDIVDYLRLIGTDLKDSTIRTHVCSVMCHNAPQNHLNKSDELERVGRGLYRLR